MSASATACWLLIFLILYLLEFIRQGTTTALMAAAVFWFINFGVRM